MQKPGRETGRGAQASWSADTVRLWRLTGGSRGNHRPSQAPRMAGLIWFVPGNGVSCLWACRRDEEQTCWGARRPKTLPVSPRGPWTGAAPPTRASPRVPKGRGWRLIPHPWAFRAFPTSALSPDQTNPNVRHACPQAGQPSCAATRPRPPAPPPLGLAHLLASLPEACLVWGGGAQSAHRGPHGVAPIAAASGECRGQRRWPGAGAPWPGPRSHDPRRGATLGPTLPRALLTWGLHPRVHVQALPAQVRAGSAGEAEAAADRASSGWRLGIPHPGAHLPSAARMGLGARDGTSSTAPRPRASWSEWGSPPAGCRDLSVQAMAGGPQELAGGRRHRKGPGGAAWAHPGQGLEGQRYLSSQGRNPPERSPPCGVREEGSPCPEPAVMAVRSLGEGT